MFNEYLNKFAAITITLLLFASLFIILPNDEVSAAGDETYRIEIDVIDKDSKVTIKTASVVLTEVHTGNKLYAYYDDVDKTYVALDPPSGHYGIYVTASGYYSEKDLAGFRFEGTEDFIHSSGIELKKFGTMQYTCNVTVKDAGSNPIDQAKVMFYDRTKKQEIISNITDINGQTSLKIFGGTTLDLVVESLTYEMYVEQLSPISGNFNKNVTLNDSVIVYGRVRSTAGSAEGVVYYMYNTNSSIPWEKRVMKDSGSNFRFDAFIGSWLLVIDGKNIDPYVEYVNISTPTHIDLGFLTLPVQTASTEKVSLNFTAWDYLTININSTWRADWAYPGLDFSDIGSLRAQVDLALGNGDGFVDITEFNQFYTYLELTHGPNYVSTSNLIVVNNTEYISISTDSVDISPFNDSYVISKEDIGYTSKVTYNSTHVTNLSYYPVNMIVPYDTLSMDRLFEVILAPGYEMTRNESSLKVDVSGYLTVNVDPLYSIIPGTETIVMDFKESVKPTAVAGLSASNFDAPARAYKMMNNTTVLYYIVRNDTAIKFTSLGSYDSNQNPISFQWDFGDGTVNTTTASYFDHNYTSPAENLTVTLTVLDIAGLDNTTSIQVWVDGLPPRVSLNVLNETGPAITIDQGDSLYFSPEGTEDDLILVGDAKGNISNYLWTFGDEEPVSKSADEENLTVTHVFNNAGFIKVVLNVTDVVSNWANDTVTIFVNDKTAPSVSIEVPQNSTGGTSLKEQSPVFFNATGTTDNYYDIEDLEFNWSFGDGNGTIGNGTAYALVNHTYESYGQYTLYLNVTDKNGNMGTLTQKVSIGSGPRPRLNVDKITFDPSIFEEGKSGTITVNITNTGSAPATGITIELWHYSLDVAQEQIGTITVIYNEDGQQVSSLDVDESGYGVFQWTPKSKGNYTIRAIAKCDNQTSDPWLAKAINVNEAGWKKIALYGGVLSIIIVIPILLFARRRIASGVGMRRMRAEKEKEKEKKK